MFLSLSLITCFPRAWRERFHDEPNLLKHRGATSSQLRFELAHSIVPPTQLPPTQHPTYFTQDSTLPNSVKTVSSRPHIWGPRDGRGASCSKCSSARAAQRLKGHGITLPSQKHIWKRMGSWFGKDWTSFFELQLHGQPNRSSDGKMTTASSSTCLSLRLHDSVQCKKDSSHDPITANNQWTCLGFIGMPSSNPLKVQKLSTVSWFHDVPCSMMHGVVSRSSHARVTRQKWTVGVESVPAASCNSVVMAWNQHSRTDGRRRRCVARTEHHPYSEEALLHQRRNH